MTALDLKIGLPSTEELPCSDDTPVDNEDQNLLPNLLLMVLTQIWAHRMDWYFGVDMGVYHTTGVNLRVPVVPDAFLSLGVERRKGGKSRRSYAIWEEGDRVPTLTVELVSHQPGGEYDEKLELYAKLGVLYYIIYNPEFWRRDQQQPFEAYKLIDQNYEQQIGEPFWMPEIGLGIGRSRQIVGGIPLEILAWFDEKQQVYPLPGSLAEGLQQQLYTEQRRSERERQRAENEYQRAERERQRADQLADYLRSLGVDPDQLPNLSP